MQMNSSSCTWNEKSGMFNYCNIVHDFVLDIQQGFDGKNQLQLILSVSIGCSLFIVVLALTFYLYKKRDSERISQL
jgi:NADH:ubiquinone oxidoreductase subunit K